MPTPNPSTGPLGELTCVEAETFCVSGFSGQVRPGGDQGLFIRDARVLSKLVLVIDGVEPASLHGRVVGGARARFAGYCSRGDDVEVDPQLLIDRRRVVSASLWEEIRITNYSLRERVIDVGLLVASDFAYIFDVKHGRTLPCAPTQIEGFDLALDDPQTGLRTIVRTTPPADEIDTQEGELRWSVTLAPRTVWAVTVTVGLIEPADSDGLSRALWPTQSWSAASEQADDEAHTYGWGDGPDVRCSDQRFARLIQQSVNDLASLLINDPAAPADRFLAAGSPWFLTLFGRDSLWAARMALPLDVDLAAQTLRVLARRQGRVHDPATEEAPGKILHEVRQGGLTDRGDLPPRYYGTMDATPLFVSLLHEAWCWGLADDRVEQLLPAAERALAWLRNDADADGDGLLEYERSGERGLANQGWKDSHDAIQFADGRLADPPIALCEVQGYAYEAARRGADLLEHFKRPGAEELRAWGEQLANRFRESFWVDDPGGAYPALALDAGKNRADALASNMGHLLACGLLNAEEVAQVAHRLGRKDLSSGWGLRTLSANSPRFNPLSYHGGSVWPHDTAIAVANLAAVGQAEVANRLLRGLVAAAPFFDYRLPELFGGEQRVRNGFPLPYPAACRPQAWAAGAALLLLRSAVGLYPDVPRGVLLLRPLWPAPFTRLDIRSLPLADGTLSVSILGGQGIWIEQSPPGLRLELQGVPRLSVRPPPPGPAPD